MYKCGTIPAICAAPILTITFVKKIVNKLKELLNYMGLIQLENHWSMFLLGKQNQLKKEHKQ